VYNSALNREHALPASSQAKPTSRSADRVYDIVKSMAITYRLRPGERINEVELARELTVSRTPLREALNRLVTEGFLTTRLNKGFFARRLDANEVFHLYEFRSAVEAAVAAIACERVTEQELDELQAFVVASKDKKGDILATQLLRLDEEFHERLARATHNDEFVRAIRAINARIHFVRWIDMQSGRRRHTQNEHLQIVHALRKRDADTAARLMRHHISRRLDQIVEVIRAGFAEIYMGNSLARHREGMQQSGPV
jgi:DNA-binding GntR family transcriptional regulator